MRNIAFKYCLNLAYKLPRFFVYCCGIRILAVATIDIWPDRELGTISLQEALTAFYQNH